LTRKIKEYYPHRSADSKVLRSARRCVCRPAIIASYWVYTSVPTICIAWPPPPAK